MYIFWQVCQNWILAVLKEKSDGNQVFGKRFLGNCGFLEFIFQTVGEILQFVLQKDRIYPLRSNISR